MPLIQDYNRLNIYGKILVETYPNRPNIFRRACDLLALRFAVKSRGHRQAFLKDIYYFDIET